jgi:hypothetical protein
MPSAKCFFAWARRVKRYFARGAEREGERAVAGERDVKRGDEAYDGGMTL